MSRPRFLTRWWFDQPLRVKGLLVLSLPLVSLLLALAMRLPFVRQQEATTGLLAHAAESRDATQRLLIALLELESSARGYALSRDRQDLAALERARDSIPQHIDTLTGLLSSGDVQQLYTGPANIARLEFERRLCERAASLARLELEQTAALVAAVERGGPDGAAAVTGAIAVSRRTMGELRETLGSLRADQDALVSDSQSTLERMQRLLRPLVIATLAGGVIGAMVAAWLFGTGIATRIGSLERNAERLARGERLRRTARGDDEIGSLETALRRASLLLRTRERELRGVNQELQRTVHEQALLNRELEAFTYSVSHDLRAPLRSIDGFAQALREDWGERMDAVGQDHLARVRNAAQRMGRLIDDLLKLSTVTRAPIQRSDVDISQLARDVIAELTTRNPNRAVDWAIQDGMHAWCDPSLARIVLENLLGNAYKFTSKTADARVEFTSVPGSSPTVYVIRDNGAGFDMKYAKKLFAPFQRLHGDREFPGSGIGLATVQRIVHKHGGEVRTEAEVNRGATFHFTLEPAKPAAAA
jgi:signal transduction histidine kinase